MKQVSLFLEYVPDKNKILDRIFSEVENYDNMDVVALTSLACYQLDKLDMEFSFPEDYDWPQKAHVDDLELCIRLTKDFTAKAFTMSFIEAALVKTNWQEFIDKYKSKMNPQKVYYCGNDFELLIEACKEKFNGFEKLD